MDASADRSTLDLADIDDEVANLTEEVVLVGEPVGSIIVRVGVEDSHAFEVVRSQKRGRIDSIANHLRVVVHLDRFADLVCAWREVDDGRVDSRGIAAAHARGLPTASVARSNSLVDGGSGVGVSSGICAEVLDNIAENLVAVLTLPHSVLGTIHGTKPESAARRC